MQQQDVTRTREAFPAFDVVVSTYLLDDELGVATVRVTQEFVESIERLIDIAERDHLAIAGILSAPQCWHFVETRDDRLEVFTNGDWRFAASYLDTEDTLCTGTVTQDALRVMIEAAAATNTRRFFAHSMCEGQWRDTVVAEAAT